MLNQFTVTTSAPLNKSPSTKRVMTVNVQHPAETAKIHLAAAHRLAALHELEEGIDNHFTVTVPGKPDQFLILPFGVHWSEAKASDIMEGAVWRDPEKLDEWIGELSREEPVITFCVYGFHIGCQTANAQKEAGFDARYMAGGHYAWKALKAPVRAFEAE